MPADVLVVVDFHDADQTQRNAFAVEVEGYDWLHHPTMANSYYTSFSDEAPDVVLVRRSENQMREAAEKAGINKWEATCIVGDTGWMPKTTDASA